MNRHNSSIEHQTIKPMLWEVIRWHTIFESKNALLWLCLIDQLLEFDQPQTYAGDYFAMNSNLCSILRVRCHLLTLMTTSLEQTGIKRERERITDRTSRHSIRGQQLSMTFALEPGGWSIVWWCRWKEKLACSLLPLCHCLLVALENETNRRRQRHDNGNDNLSLSCLVSIQRYSFIKCLRVSSSFSISLQASSFVYSFVGVNLDCNVLQVSFDVTSVLMAPLKNSLP